MVKPFIALGAQMSFNPLAMKIALGQEGQKRELVELSASLRGRVVMQHWTNTECGYTICQAGYDDRRRQPTQRPETVVLTG